MTVQKRRWFCLITILCLFVVETVVWFLLLDVDHYSISADADGKSIYPSSVLYVSGYDVQDDDFVANNDDPQICFFVETEKISCLIVDLSEPLSKDTQIQVYYALENEDLNEKNQVRITARAGAERIVIPLKKAAYQTLRLDFDGSFSLRDVQVSEATPHARYRVDGSTVGRLLFFLAVTAVAGWIVYAVHENQLSDGDPIPRKIHTWLSQNIPHERLNVREKQFLLLCFLIYFGWSLVFLDVRYGPDEVMRYDVPQFIFRHRALPFGGEEELINSYWGISYGFSITLPYLLDVLFMRIVSLFTMNSHALWLAARFTSVVSTTGTAYFSICIAKRMSDRPSRWLFIIPMALTPQVVFLSSYVNLDSFAFFTVTLLIYIWIRGMQNQWDIRSCIWFGVGLGLCLISYQFAYPFALGSSLLYCIWYFLHCKQIKFKKFFLNGLLIIGVALLISGWYFIRNAVLYHGDIFALRASVPYAEKYAVLEQRPSLKQTFRRQGYSILGMLKETNWIRSTFYSMFYGLGYMEWFLPVTVYRTIFAVLLIGFAGSIYALIRKRGKWNRDTAIGVGMMAISAVVAVGISLYYSWASDYQPQGRYVIAVLPFLFAMTAYGFHHLLNLIRRDNRLVQKCAARFTLFAFLLFDLIATFDCLTHLVY